MAEFYQKITAKEPLRRIKAARSGDVWAHADTRDAIDELTRHYDLDSHIVRDVCDERELARVETSGHATYVFFRKLTREYDGHAISAPILAVLLPDTLITMSPHTPFNPTGIRDESLPTTDKPASVLVVVLGTLVTQYEQHIHDINEKVKTLRNRLRTHEVSNDDFILFVSIDDNLNHYNQNLDGLLAVMRRLRENRQVGFTSHDLEVIDDISLHIEQLAVAIKSAGQTINSIQNAYSTIANNRLNHRMKALTVFTVLLALPNVFYGMFGMNVRLPYQDEPWAYAAIVGLTGALIVVIYAIAKRLRLF